MWVSTASCVSHIPFSVAPLQKCGWITQQAQICLCKWMTAKTYKVGGDRDSPNKHGCGDLCLLVLFSKEDCSRELVVFKIAINLSTKAGCDKSDNVLSRLLSNHSCDLKSAHSSMVQSLTNPTYTWKTTLPDVHNCACALRQLFRHVKTFSLSNSIGRLFCWANRPW